MGVGIVAVAEIKSLIDCAAFLVDTIAAANPYTLITLLHGIIRNYFVINYSKNKSGNFYLR